MENTLRGNTTGAMSFSALVDRVKNLTKSTSSLKYGIFKVRLKMEDLDPGEITAYLNKLNGFLSYWDESADNLSSAIKNATGTEGVHAIQYEEIKDIIHFKNDYAAVLPFANGIITGMREHKMSAPEDIDDFANHTVKKAFNGSSCEPMSYLEDIRLLMGSNRVAASPLDAKTFNAVSKQKLFDHSDSRELYQAAHKTVDYLIRNIDQSIFSTQTAADVRLFASAVSHIIDFITYSAVVYAARIYVIYSYAYPYIIGVMHNTLSRDSDTVYTPESTDVSGSEAGGCPVTEVTILRDANDADIRNPDKSRELREILDVFIGRIGAPDQSSIQGHQYQNDNAISKLLAHNALHEFLIRGYNGNDDQLSREILKELVYSPSHPMDQGQTSAKNEMLHIIRGIKCGDTIKECRDNAVNLRNYIVGLAWKLTIRIEDMIRYSSRRPEDNDLKITDVKAVSEITKIYIDLYHELIGCAVQKCRDIEQQYNRINGTETKKVLDKISLNTPGDKENDSNHTMMTAVPDTIRIPMAIIDGFSVPTFEELQMYDEYLRSLPEYADSTYLSEAVDISSMWNKLMAMIDAAFKRLAAFINNAKTEHALNWVTKNERRILDTTYPSPAKMTEIPKFKDKVGKPVGFDNLINGLKSFTMKDIETPDALEKFTKKLYPSEQVYSFWSNQTNSSGDKKGTNDGDVKYKNLILFTDNPANATAAEPVTVTLTGDALRKEVAGWVETIKSVKGAMNDIQSTHRELTEAIKSIKQKLSASNSSTDTASVSPSGSGQTEKKPEQNSQDPNPKGDVPADAGDNGNTGNAGGDLRNMLLSNIMIAQTRLYQGLLNALAEYITKSYKLIQRAYGLGKRPEA